MPLGRYPERVGPFQKWATDKVKNSKLSDSVTPSGVRGFRKRRTRRRKRKNKDA